MKSYEIRNKFLQFFESKGHKIIDSFPLTIEDPTLLFVNSGMAPLKDYFLGNVSPESNRITTSQVCLRISGKHNDLRNIGSSKRHHTCFEMLGNFSFGAYSREEATRYAIEFLVNELKIDESNLHYTHHISDDHARNILLDLIKDKSKIISLSNDDNKWSMGKYGPFGYCIEVFYARDDELTEIWNMVYMTHEYRSDDKVYELKNKCIDTGMGLERITAVLQNTDDNYKCDMFDKYFEILSRYITLDKDNVHQRIIVDHARAIENLLKEGIIPEPVKHGYILRLLIRKLIVNIYMLVNNIDKLKDITSVYFNNDIRILSEVDMFSHRLIEASKLIRKDLNDKEIFQLYETHGIPLEIIEDIIGIKINEDTFNRYMNEHKRISQSKNMSDEHVLEVPNISTKFIGYESLSCSSNVVGNIDKYIILDQTPFYFESGGQESDTGQILYKDKYINVINVIKKGNTILHEVDNIIDIGSQVECIVDKKRRDNLSRAHSATHLMHRELFTKYNAMQCGSLVRENSIRFDVVCGEEIDTRFIEERMNYHISSSIQRKTEIKNTKSAISEGAMSLFSEKYPEESRVITIGDSYELCGGTHINNSAEIGYFRILSIKSISKGVKRIEAYVGEKAYEDICIDREIINKISSICGVGRENIIETISQMINSNHILTNENRMLRIKTSDIKIINNKIHTLYLENSSLEEMAKLVDRNYEVSIIASSKYIRIESKQNTIEEYIDSFKKHFTGKGGGNNNIFSGRFDIIHNKFSIWRDSLL